MSFARVMGIASIVAAVVAGSACGSSEPPGNASPPTTAKKLTLSATGRAGTPSEDSGAPAIYPVRPTRYVLDAALPDLGASAIVRRMESPAVSAADVQRFAGALALAGTPATTSSGWQVQSGDATLTVDRSGATVRVSYSRGAPGAVGGSSGAGSAPASGGASTPASAVPDEPATSVAPAGPASGSSTTVTTAPAPPVDVPDPAEARSIARALLDEMGVLAGQDWATSVYDSGGVAVACPAGVPCPAPPPEVSARTVSFSLVLDGSTLDGDGWSVTIGEHRRVESVDGTWASPVAVGSYPLRSTAAVFADLQQGTARHVGPQPLAADTGVAGGEGVPDAAPPTDATSTTAPPAVVVHVAGVSLGAALWEGTAGGATVAYLVPTYRFRARVDGGTAYDIEVLALDPAAVTFVNPAPEPEPLPAEPAPAPAQG